MSLDSINKKQFGGRTPLDYAYRNNRSPLRQEIIALLRSKGGIANRFDENGDRIEPLDHIDEEDLLLKEFKSQGERMRIK